MFYYDTVSPGLRRLLVEIQALEALKRFRLAGGTALALQYGHRQSVDLDFFGPFDGEDFGELLAGLGKTTLVKSSANIHVYVVDGVKVDFVNHRYPWLEAPLREEGVALASDKDIAAMKIAAITGRGSKKDFVDLYFLLKRYSLEEILELFLKKYDDGSAFLALKSLNYFSDADTEPMPLMSEPIHWSDIQFAISKEVNRLMV